MAAKAYPGYEYNLNLYQIIAEGTEEEKAAAREAQRKYISGYTKPEGMRMEDLVIAGGDGQDMKLRVFTPAGLPEKAPIVIDIHGGGWVAGSAAASISTTTAASPSPRARPRSSSASITACPTRKCISPPR